MNLDLLRDGDGRLTTVGDNVNAARNAAFGYTDAGRLMTAAGPWGSDVYGYDAGGNRTSVSRTIGSATVAESVLPAANSNRLISVSSGGSTVRSFSHSPAGNVLSDVRGGLAYGYTYDARGRLATASINGTVVGRYGYGAFGRRSYREATQGPATVRRHYLFDGDGRLLAEHDADTGAAVREYVWLDDTPLALIDREAGGAPRTLFIHAGPLDEPLMMTDASGVIVWEARLEPFGAATVLAGPSAAMDLRLPGQELQQETGGLHQNFHRDYDPSLGRYLQPDPLGLEAGPNAYAYVDGDPLNAVDPEGLDAIYVNHSIRPSTAGQGHGGILVSNGGRGWRYYSKDGYGRGNFEVRDYPTFRHFLDDQRGRYDRAIRIPASPQQDARMRNAGERLVRTPYDFALTNCADLVNGVLRAGGIRGCECGTFSNRSSFGTSPNRLYNSLRSRYGEYARW